MFWQLSRLPVPLEGMRVAMELRQFAGGVFSRIWCGTVLAMAGDGGTIASVVTPSCRAGLVSEPAGVAQG